MKTSQIQASYKVTSPNPFEGGLDVN